MRNPVQPTFCRILICGETLIQDGRRKSLKQADRLLTDEVALPLLLKPTYLNHFITLRVIS